MLGLLLLLSFLHQVVDLFWAHCGPGPMGLGRTRNPHPVHCKSARLWRGNVCLYTINDPSLCAHTYVECFLEACQMFERNGGIGEYAWSLAKSLVILVILLHSLQEPV